MRNIEEKILKLEEEVMVIGDIGVEIGFGKLKRDDEKNERLSKMVKSVV